MQIGALAITLPPNPISALSGETALLALVAGVVVFIVGTVWLGKRGVLDIQVKTVERLNEQRDVLDKTTTQTIATLTSDYGREREKRLSMESRLDALDGKFDALKDDHDTLRQEHVSLQLKHAALQSDHATLTQRLSETERRLQEAEAHAHEREAEYAHKTKQREDKLHDMGNELTHLTLERDHLKIQLARNEKESAINKTRIEELERRLDAGEGGHHV